MANLAGDVTGAPGSNTVAFVGGLTAGSVAFAVNMVNFAAWDNVFTALVRRDGTGSFSAQNIGLAGTLSVGASHVLRGPNATNLFLGAGAGNAGVTGANNLGIGPGALPGVTVGFNNTAFGPFALGSMANGTNNVAVGTNALNASSFSSLNVAVGSGALQSNANGGANVAIGYNTGNALTGGGQNTFIGGNAAKLVNSGPNVIIGYNSMTSLTAGANNTTLGTSSGATMTSGDFNTLVGHNSGISLTSGNSNIMVGNASGSLLTSGSNNIYIGNGGVVSESATIRIGTNAQTQTHISGIWGSTVVGGASVLIANDGKLGTVVSSRRFKNDIAPMGDTTDLIMKLRPVTFTYKPEYGGSRDELQYGLIAEEVADAEPSLVIFGADGRAETVRYHFLAPILLKEIQSQRLVIEELTRRIEALERK